MKSLPLLRILFAFIFVFVLFFTGCNPENAQAIIADTDNNTTKPVETTPNDSNEIHSTLSYELQSYYADALNKKGEALKSSLHTIISDSAIFLTYAQDYDLLSKTDKDFSKPSEENLILFYLQESVTADSRCGSDGSNCWNREHMWPKSLGVGDNPLVNSYTDLHHLRPSNVDVNGFRGNKPYGDATIPYNKIDGFYYDEKFEVRDNLKGDVARAILYMAVRYEGDNNEPDLEIYANDFSDTRPAELCTMLRWNHIDPVTSAEIKRNDIVQSYQGNRNPFVDDALWADTIWGSQCDLNATDINGSGIIHSGADTNNTHADIADTNITTSGEIANLYFSEYVEGSSYNKALEIYNASDVNVSLRDYEILLYTNGKTVPNTPILLSSVVLEPGKTYVLVHTSANIDFQTQANQSTSLDYNGDDAVALVYSATQTPVDVIGQIGIDPGSAWINGSIGTLNQTLRRKTTVTAGDIDGANPFDPATEWDSFVQDTFEHLGTR